MTLEGTVKTPFGPMQKKTALMVGGGIVVLGGIVWYRHKQAGSGTVDSTATDAEIDPATGYPYGSPEDAAALQEQSSYVSPPAPSGGGGSSYPTGGTGFTSNGAWTQAVVEYMTGNGLVSDPTALAAALGKYTTGSYVAPGSSDESLINQAIAVEGFPPVAGPNGYPPAINRNPPQGGTSTTTHVTAPTGLHVTSTSKTALTLAWNAVPGARGYKASVNNKGHGTTYYPGITLTNLKPNTSYKITVSAVGQGSDQSANAALTAKTAK